MIDDAPLLALTLWQPWAWCIAHHRKRVENREWPPPQSLVGQRFAIHAGQHYDAGGVASRWTVAPTIALAVRAGEEAARGRRS